VSEMKLSCIGMSEFYSMGDEAEAIAMQKLRRNQVWNCVQKR